MEIKARAIGLVLLAAATCTAEIVDRVAANIGLQVITDSEVREQVRLAAFIEGEEPNYSRESLRATLDRMIDQALMRIEIDFMRYQGSAQEEVAPVLAQVKSRFPDDNAYRAALQKYNLDESALLEHLRWQLTMMRFIEFRFQPAIELSDVLMRQEYRQQARVWKEKNGSEAPPYEEIRGEIEKIVRQRLIDSAVDRWLSEARTQNTILYHEGYQ